MTLPFKYFIAFNVILFFFSACAGDKDKSNVEEQNEDKFKEKGKRKEAQFIVDALDLSYAILEVAQIGEERSIDVKIKGKAKRIVEGQTKVANVLKIYAENSSISTPFSGPERTTRDVKKLYEVESETFDKAWRKELVDLNNELMSKFKDYKPKTKDSLNFILQDLTLNLKSQADILEELN